MNQLDPAVKKVWAIRYAIWTIALFIAAVFYDGVGILGGGERLLPPGVITLLIVAAGTASIFVVPRLRYRRWRYALGDEELVLSYGVLTHVRTVVPLRRVQHLDVSQSLVEREFGLGTFTVHTAGTRASTVSLPGLRIEVANRLHDDVKKHVIEDAL